MGLTKKQKAARNRKKMAKKSIKAQQKKGIYKKVM
jgi:hypothetical protein